MLDGLSNEIEQALVALRQAIIKQIDELTAASLLKEQPHAVVSGDNHLETVVLPNAPVQTSPSGIVAGGAEVDNSLPYPNLPSQAVNLPTPPSSTPATLPVNQPQEVAIPNVSVPNLAANSASASFDHVVNSTVESPTFIPPAAAINSPTAPAPNSEPALEFVPNPSEQEENNSPGLPRVDFASSPSQTSFAKARGLLSSVLQKNN